jgi:hypothetical protein
MPMLAILIFSLEGCLPGSRYYKPVSEWEEQEFNRANRNIFPNDVRVDVESYVDSVIAWPGIILNHEVKEHDDRIELFLRLEHHYYDWIEDFSIQRARIFLSPRSEGQFSTSWIFIKDTSIDELSEHAKQGNLAIVYGNPIEIIEDSVIVVKSTYIRGLNKKWYRTDIMDYGRPKN